MITFKISTRVKIALEIHRPGEEILYVMFMNNKGVQSALESLKNRERDWHEFLVCTIDEVSEEDLL